MSDTPIVDSESYGALEDEVVLARLARRLERDRAELIEALRDSKNALTERLRRPDDPYWAIVSQANALLARIEKE